MWHHELDIQGEDEFPFHTRSKFLLAEAIQSIQLSSVQVFAFAGAVHVSYPMEPFCEGLPNLRWQECSLIPARLFVALIRLRCSVPWRGLSSDPSPSPKVVSQIAWSRAIRQPDDLESSAPSIPRIHSARQERRELLRTDPPFRFRLNSLVELRSFENRVFALNKVSIKLIHNVVIVF